MGVRGKSRTSWAGMSVPGQKQTSIREFSTSAVPSTADIYQEDGNVSFVANNGSAASFVVIVFAFICCLCSLAEAKSLSAS